MNNFPPIELYEKVMLLPGGSLGQHIYKFQEIDGLDGGREEGVGSEGKFCIEKISSLCFESHSRRSALYCGAS